MLLFLVPILSMFLVPGDVIVAAAAAAALGAAAAAAPAAAAAAAAVCVCVCARAHLRPLAIACALGGARRMEGGSVGMGCGGGGSVGRWQLDRADRSWPGGSWAGGSRAGGCWAAGQVGRPTERSRSWALRTKLGGVLVGDRPGVRCGGGDRPTGVVSRLRARSWGTFSSATDQGPHGGGTEPNAFLHVLANPQWGSCQRLTEHVAIFA